MVESRTRLLTPFRLIVAVIGLVGIATIWGLWHRHRVESAKAIVMVANEAGMKSLKEGDFVAASRELTRARDAVDLLRRTDPEANAIRRNCREAIAANGLATSTLFEILAESRESKSRFLSVYRDSWLILDTVISNPEAKDQSSIIDVPLMIDGTTYRIEINSPTIRAAAEREQSSGIARVIFAAQMSEIRPSSLKDPNSALVLNGKSAFLWTTLETYISVGYVENREHENQLTGELLDRQRESAEVSK